MSAAPRCAAFSALSRQRKEAARALFFSCAPRASTTSRLRCARTCVPARVTAARLFLGYLKQARGRPAGCGVRFAPKLPSAVRVDSAGAQVRPARPADARRPPTNLLRRHTTGPTQQAAPTPGAFESESESESKSEFGRGASYSHCYSYAFLCSLPLPGRRLRPSSATCPDGAAERTSGQADASATMPPPTKTPSALPLFTYPLALLPPPPRPANDDDGWSEREKAPLAFADRAQRTALLFAVSHARDSRLATRSLIHPLGICGPEESKRTGGPSTTDQRASSSRSARCPTAALPTGRLHCTLRRSTSSSAAAAADDKGRRLLRHCPSGPVRCHLRAPVSFH